MAHQYYYENKEGNSWLRPKTHNLEISKINFVPASLVGKVSFDKKEERISITKNFFALDIEKSSDKKVSLLHSKNTNSNAPLNAYLFSLFENFADLLNLPVEIREKNKSAIESLKEIENIGMYTGHTTYTLLGPARPSWKIEGFTISLEPYYFEKNETNLNSQNGEDLEENLRILRNFLNLNEEIITYAEKNIDKIEEALGRVVLHSKLKLEYRNSLYGTNLWKQQNKENKKLDITFVDNLVLIPEIDNNYMYGSNNANTRKFKTAKDHKLFLQNRSQIEQDLSSLIKATYKEKHKSIPNTQYSVKLTNEIYDYAKSNSLTDVKEIVTLTEKPIDGFPEVHVFAQTLIPFRKILPNIPRISKGLKDALTYADNYKSKIREHKDKYGEKNIYFIFATPKETENKSYLSSGFFINKSGTRLTLDIETAQSFASEDIARTFFEKSQKSAEYEASFVKTQLRIQSFTGAKPTSNKEFVNFLSQWETEEIKKMFDSPAPIEKLEPSTPAKKPNKI